MRKTLIISTIIMAAVSVFTLYCGISHALYDEYGITNSPHNMSSIAGNGGMFQFDTTSICVYCHTPHGANLNVTGDTYFSNATSSYTTGGSEAAVMLWNRNLGTTTSYTLYTSSTFNNFSNQVRVWSLMCMSCHDGVSALNVLRNPPVRYQDVGSDLGDVMNDTDADNAPDLASGFEHISELSSAYMINIGGRNYSSDDGVTKLADDHPVSFDYPDVGSQEPGLMALTPNGGDRYVGDPAVRLFPRPSDMAKFSVECPTCHDVHNYGDTNKGTTPFLVVSNNGSNLCLQCHLK